ncbi:hypothetical protein [Bradyrhizobium sp. URHC0002]
MAGRNQGGYSMLRIGFLAAAVACTTLMPSSGFAQTAPPTPPSITTPDKVETRVGTIDFKDGAPSKATLEKVYDEIDSANAQRAFSDTFQGVSIHTIRTVLHEGLAPERDRVGPLDQSD